MTARRLLSTGVPALAASALTYLQPIVGQPFLSHEEYGTWALGASLLSMSLVFDLGGATFVMAASGAGALTAQRIRAAAALSAIGSLSVGALACAAWIPYTLTSDLALAGQVGVWYLLAITVAGVTRSVGLVGVAGLLGSGRHVQRSVALILQAITQLVVMMILLWQGASVWALPSAALASSVLFIILSLPGFRTITTGRAGADHLELRRFAWSRAGLTGLGLVLMQADRWVVGAIASPAMLTAYDVATRLGGIPRLAVVGLSAVLAVDGATAAKVPGQIGVLYRQATRILLAVTAGLSVVVMAGAMAMNTLAWSVPPLLVGLVLAGYGLNGLTAPGTLLFSSLGRPQMEFTYLLPCVATSAMLWLVSGQTGSEVLAVSATSISLLLWSGFFVLYAGRRLDAVG